MTRLRRNLHILGAVLRVVVLLEDKGSRADKLLAPYHDQPTSMLFVVAVWYFWSFLKATERIAYFTSSDTNKLCAFSSDQSTRDPSARVHPTCAFAYATRARPLLLVLMNGFLAGEYSRSPACCRQRCMVRTDGDEHEGDEMSARVVSYDVGDARYPQKREERDIWWTLRRTRGGVV